MPESIADDQLGFRPAFQAALGGISRSTIIRLENSGRLPSPDAWIGCRPAWLGSTIKKTVQAFIAAGDGRRPERDKPRSPGRPRKSQASKAGVAT
jgi:predicted DNA-binding transcriptional regulator AlpA